MFVFLADFRLKIIKSRNKDWYFFLLKKRVVILFLFNVQMKPLVILYTGIKIFDTFRLKLKRVFDP